ncbi:MAG: lipoate--protein ligase family protein [Candidatus Nezhaarchaeales archaeon]
MVWRLLRVEEPANPNLNLAIEEALFRTLNCEGLIRFWRNNNAVVIGRFQCPLSEVNYDKALELKVRVVRRFTGGGAVFHDLGNLNFTFMFKAANRSLAQMFGVVGEIVSDALKRIGVNASFKPINDIIIDSRKVAGLAGTAWNDRILVHGCLLVNSNIDILSMVLNVSSEKLIDKAVSSIRARVTTLSLEVKREVPIADVEEAILHEAKSKLDISELREEGLTEDEAILARDLYREKYLSVEWLASLCKACPLREVHAEKIRKLVEVARPDKDG